MLTWIFSSRANCLIFCQLIVYPFAFKLIVPPLLCSQTNPDNFLIVCCFNPAYVVLCLSPGSSSQSAPAKQRPLSGPQPLASQPPPAPLLLSPPVIFNSLSLSFGREQLRKWIFTKSLEIFLLTCPVRIFVSSSRSSNPLFNSTTLSNSCNQSSYKSIRCYLY